MLPLLIPAAADLRKCMADDASPVNRITAAEALGRAGHKKEAIAAIKKELAKADADMLALHALEALDQLGPESILTPEEIASIEKRKFNYALRLAPRVGTGKAPSLPKKKNRARDKARAKSGKKI